MPSTVLMFIHSNDTRLAASHGDPVVKKNRAERGLDGSISLPPDHVGNRGGGELWVSL